ncbi:DUF3108 domain-containing protein [uncultured Acinetobacter sp.]|uniref:DUF3108 domain-containing protein n=1 Tax=uncultured Acinetobacter sp. TaxID=165433 RepID=UPI0026079304|nr:DUF3108 domain-containing protein [uncultured Acinetobacter sp.]
MATSLKKLLLTTLSASALLLSANSAFAMSPFHATYQFSYNGKNMGSATRNLARSGNTWTYVFSAKAGGIASASETSRFSLNNGKITSSSFSRTSKILVHNNTMSIQFNPSKKLINTKKDDKPRSFAWQANVLDELNAELQLREDLKGSGLKSSYLIADAKEVEARRFIKQGTERVSTNYGTFDTVKVILKPTKPNRGTIFWLAPELDYLPVKVTHQDGKTSYGLSLTGYQGPRN